MTEKRFVLEDEVIIDNNSIADDGGRQLYWTVEYVQRQKLVDLMNTLAEENEQLKKILNELSDMLQFDVENGIRSYPVKLSEYLSNALKELQE